MAHPWFWIWKFIGYLNTYSVTIRYIDYIAQVTNLVTLILTGPNRCQFNIDLTFLDFLVTMHTQSSFFTFPMFSSLQIMREFQTVPIHLPAQKFKSNGTVLRYEAVIFRCPRCNVNLILLIHYFLHFNGTIMHKFIVPFLSISSLSVPFLLVSKLLLPRCNLKVCFLRSILILGCQLDFVKKNSFFLKG